MASFKATFPVLQELFAKNHRGAQRPPPAGRRLVLHRRYINGAKRKIRVSLEYNDAEAKSYKN